MWSFGDLPPFPTSYSQAVESFLSAWQPQSLGNSIPRTPLLLLFAAVQFLLGDNGILAQKVFYLSLLPLSMATMYHLLSQFLGSRIARSLGAFFFVTNPIIGGEFVGGAVGLLFCYALLPLLIESVIGTLRRPRDSIPWVGLSLFVLLYGWITPQLLPLLLVTILFIWVFMWKRLKVSVPLRAKIPRVAYFSASLLLLYAWFFFGSPLSTAVVSLPIRNLLGEVSINYSANDLQTTLRLGYWSFLLQPLGYTESTLSNGLGFALPLLAFSGLLGPSKSRPLYFAFSVLSVSILAVVSLVRAGVFEGLFRLLPVLFIYRGPTMPLYFLSFSYAMLAAISADTWIERSGRKFHASKVHPPSIGKINISRLSLLTRTRGITAIALILITLSSVVYSAPILDGTMGQGATRNNHYATDSRLYEATNWIQGARASQGFFRTLWVPLTFQDYNALSWIDPYVFALPLGANVYGYPSRDLISGVLSLLCSSSTTSIGVLLGEASVKYVILDLGSPSTGNCSENGGLPSGAPTLYHFLLDNQEDLHQIEVMSGFIIYLNLDFAPRVATATQLLPTLNLEDGTNPPVWKRVSGNLLLNPGFQNNATDWNPWLKDLISYQFEGGTQSATATMTRPADGGLSSTWVPELWQVIPVTSGSQYEISSQVSSSNSRGFHVQVSWFKDADRSLRIDTESLAVTSSNESQPWTWSSISGTFLAPWGARFLLIELLGGFSFDGANPAIVSYRAPSVYEIFEETQPTISDLGFLLLASQLPFAKKQIPPLLISHTWEDLASTSLSLGLKEGLVYVNNPEGRNQAGDVAAQSNISLTYVTSALAVLQVGDGNWHQSGNPVYSPYKIANGTGTASGALNFSGLNLGPSRIWIHGIVNGNLFLSISNYSLQISDSTGLAKWYAINLTSTPAIIPFQFSGALLSIQGFIAEPTWSKSVWNDNSQLSYRVDEESVSNFTVQVSVSVPFFLIFRDSYDTYWRAEINSQPLDHRMSAVGFNIFVSRTGFGQTVVHLLYSGQTKTTITLLGFAVFILIGIAWIAIARKDLILHKLVKRIAPTRNLPSRLLQGLRKRLYAESLHEQS